MNRHRYSYFNRIPHLGQRIIKTGIAVFICLIIYWLRGFQGLVTQSTVAAIICIQPYWNDSIRTSLNRIIGTLIGAGWAVLFLETLVLLSGQDIHPHIILVYITMGLGVIFTLYSTVLIKKTDAASLAAIVFICIVAVYPDYEMPFETTLNRIIDTVIGIVVAGLVNSLTLPRRKHKEYLFFIRSQYLVPDRFAHATSNVMVILNRLYEDGAKVCLVSKWVPAFMIEQMGIMNVNVPVIVMDGAALYDIPNHQYIHVLPIEKTAARFLREFIKEMGLCYAAGSVRERSLMVYRGGKMNEAEKLEYELMKYSSHRNYIEGEFTDEDQICYIRIIDTDDKIEELEQRLGTLLPDNLFRMEKRSQHRLEGYSGIYFYNPQATVERGQVALIRYLEEKENIEIIPVDMTDKDEYVSENESIVLLNKIRSIYEPVYLPWKR